MNLPSSVLLIAPFATWMSLMSILPSTALGYAVRTLVTTGVLMLSCWQLLRPRGRSQCPCRWLRTNFSALAWGLGMGLAVFALWVFPERFEIYRILFILGDVAVKPGESPFDPAVCGWPLTLVRLFGSAVIISAAEELFFRKWLIRFAGFWWMVFLFAIEHDRWLVGALAGIAYGWLYLRKGLFSAILAHAVTNLVLGLWIFKTGNWAFW